MKFEEWLARAGYRESTQRATCRQVEAARSALLEGDEPSAYLAGAIRRWMAWAQSEGLRGDELGQFEALGYAAVVPSTGAREGRKTPRRSFTDEDWANLLGTLAGDDTRNAAVLRLMATTSLRVGDVLGIPWTAMDEGLQGAAVAVERKGGRFIEVPTEGSLPEWEALYRGLSGGGFQDDIVASYVCDRPGCSPIAGEAAYQRVNRHLKALGDELGLPAPVHLHRLRRTLAVQALRTTKDMTIVQQLLGHASLSSTERYVDELRTADVGRLQTKLGQYREPRS